MSDDAIKAFVRLRPFNGLELEKNSTEIVSVEGNNIHVAHEGSYHSFAFDRVMPQGVSQTEVYHEVARTIVADIFHGYNGTIFTYGQTGSGKTHTMLGPPEQPGILPQAVQQIFAHVRDASQHIQFEIKVSVVEIYNEKVRDLLAEPGLGQDLMLYEDFRSGGSGVYIKDCTELFVVSPEEVNASVCTALANRVTTSTRMNEASSRSHCIVYVKVTQKDVVKGETRRGKLFLVDLAGSEKISKTAAVAQTLKEAKNINRSLSCLTSVIVALTEAKKQHIPYRDSKLTRILQDSLGGNAKTALVLCSSTASYNAEEIIATLRFGITAKKVVNKVRVNREETVEELQAVLESLLADIAARRKGMGLAPSVENAEAAKQRDRLMQELDAKRKEWQREEEHWQTEQLLARLKEHHLRCATRLAVHTVEGLTTENQVWEEEYNAALVTLHERNENGKIRRKAIELQRRLLQDLQRSLGEATQQIHKYEEQLSTTVPKVEAFRRALAENGTDPASLVVSPDDALFIRWAEQAQGFLYPMDKAHHLVQSRDAILTLNEHTFRAMKEAHPKTSTSSSDENHNASADDVEQLTQQRDALVAQLGQRMKQGRVPNQLVKLWITYREKVEEYSRQHSHELREARCDLDTVCAKETAAVSGMESLHKQWLVEYHGLCERWRVTVPPYYELMEAERVVDELGRQLHKDSYENYRLRMDMQRYERLLTVRNDRVEDLNKGVREGWKDMNRTHQEILQVRARLQTEIEEAKVECARWKEQAIRSSYYSPIKQAF